MHDISLLFRSSSNLIYFHLKVYLNFHQEGNINDHLNVHLNEMLTNVYLNVYMKIHLNTYTNVHLNDHPNSHMIVHMYVYLNKHKGVNLFHLTVHFKCFCGYPY